MNWGRYTFDAALDHATELYITELRERTDHLLGVESDDALIAEAAVQFRKKSVAVDKLERILIAAKQSPHAHLTRSAIDEIKRIIG